MSRQVDSDALVPVGRQLGLTGQGNPQTILEDASLPQVFDVGSAVRRGRADIGTGGLWFGVTQNSHVAAGGLGSALNPYAAGESNVLNSYPPLVGRDFDVWLHGVSAVIVAGSGATLTGPTFFQWSGTGIDRFIGPNVEDGGGAVAGVSVGPGLARFNSFEEGALGTLRLTNSSTGQIYHPINLRWPRGATGIMTTEGTGAAVTVRGLWHLSLFPVGMGTDGNS